MKMFERLIVRRNTVLIGGFSALLIGVFAAYFYDFSFPVVFAVGATVILSLVAIKKRKLRLMAVIIMGLLIGFWRGGVVFQKLQQYELLYGQEVALEGRALDDVGYNEERKQFQFHITDVSYKDQDYIGRIQISTKQDPDVTQGDMVAVVGKLKKGIGTSRQGSITFADTKVLRRNDSWLEIIRHKFFSAIHRALPEPQASLGLGYLVGLRVSIPKDLSDQLALVGLTHIIAVSGYNLTIIVQAMRRLFGKKSAYQAVLFSGLLIVGFLLVAGSSAPINRAAIVSGLGLLAWYFGRVIRPSVLLLVSGAATGLVNPLYVWGDPGWYLSFLAFAGVLLLAPAITRRYFSHKPPGVVKQTLIETLCAQIATAPYVLYLFGGVSVIAPVANVLVLPMIPVVMLLVFTVGVVAMISVPVAVVIGTIPSALLTLQIWVIDRLSRVSWARTEVEISLAVMIISFIIIFCFGYIVHCRSLHHESLPDNDDQLTLV
jgi:ComEC/Rec2-related protein